jgi:hypothetical protein
MAVNLAQLNFVDLKLDIVYNFEERIKSLCGNFIRIVRSTVVYLVHKTARDFLLQEINSQPPKLGKWQHSFILKEAHSQMLDICLQYLSYLNRPSRPLDNSTDTCVHPINFLDYAGRFWTQHYSELEPNLTDGQLQKCVQLCNSNSSGFGQWFKRASESARNPKHEMKEGTMQRDIAFHLGLDQVV